MEPDGSVVPARDAGPAGRDAAAGPADAGSAEVRDGAAGPADAGSTEVRDGGHADGGVPGPQWEWINPLPQGNSLFDLSLASEAHGWAVGDFGTTLHFEHGTWTVVPAPTEEPLLTVHAIDPSLAWAAGGAGVILRWQGNEWARVESGVTDLISDIWGASPNFALAVVGNHSLIAWDGTRWAPFTGEGAALPRRVLQVHGVSASDFWVRGADGREPVLLHSVDGAFARVAIPFERTTTLHARSADDAWLVNGLEIARWNGRAWHPIPAPLPASFDDGQHYDSVAAPGPDEAYFVGIHQSLRFDGSGWHVLGGRLGPTPIVSAAGSTVRMLFSSRRNYPTILRPEGDVLVKDVVDVFPHRPPLSGYLSLWGAHRDDVWAGSLRWNGHALEYLGDRRSAPVHTIAIDGLSSDDIFFVGYDGMAAHWDGSQVAMIDTGVAVHLAAVTMLAPGRALAVGVNGTILELTRDGAVAPHSSGTVVTLSDVWAAAPDDIFAVGLRGTILHYDGTRWARFDTELSSDLHAIRGRSATDVYAAGADGVLLHFDGAMWHRISGTTPEMVFFALAFDGEQWWIAGGHRSGYPGAIWTWDGVLLREEAMRLTHRLHSIVALADGDIWVAGATNAVLRRRARC